MYFLEELKRRNVIKVGAVYLIVGWLETAWEIRDPGLLQAGEDALLDPLREEPRFRKVLESAGL